MLSLGFKCNKNVFQCCLSSDIDECVAGKNLCPYNRQCVNTFGSYFCKCQEGYDLKYVDGKYDCVGKVYKVSRGSRLWKMPVVSGSISLLVLPDHDECATDTHKCSHHADCLNTQGSYKCKCKSGFRGNGFECSGELQSSLTVKKWALGCFCECCTPASGFYRWGVLCWNVDTFT